MVFKCTPVPQTPAQSAFAPCHIQNQPRKSAVNEMLIYLFYFTKHVSFLVASRQNIPLKPIKNTPKREKSLRARAHFSPFWGYLLCFCLSILRKTALHWRSQKQEKAYFFILSTLRFAAFHLAFCRR